MWARASLAAAVVAGLLTFAPAVVAGPADDAARQLAGDIEHRAAATSFADLERFGEPARRRARTGGAAPPAPRRADLPQPVGVRPVRALERPAGRQGAGAGDRRYGEVARIDALKSRYDRGDISVRREIERIADSEPTGTPASTRSDRGAAADQEGESGAALKLLFEAEDAGPER